MKQHYSLLYMILACVFLVGCNRGCTTTSTLDSENKYVTRQGQEIELKASVLDYRNSRRTNGNVFDRTITHSYGLSFVVKMYGQSYGQFYTEGVDDPDAVDLPAELKRIKVNLSKDRNHMGLGVDGKVVYVFHILNGKSIQTNSSEWAFEDGMDWADLRLESYPHPGVMLMHEVQTNCDFVSINKEEVFTYLDSKHASDTMHRVLLSQWPECSTAEDYLTEKRTRKLLKNSKWKSYAVNRGIEVLKKNSLASWELEEAYTFLESLNSPKIMRLMDSVCVTDWGSNSDKETTEKLLQRMKNKRNPMDGTQRLEVIIEAGTQFEKYMRTGHSYYKRSPTSCLSVLLASGDTLLAHQFLEDALLKNPKKYDDYDFYSTLYDNYKAYTPAQKQLLDREIPNLFAACKDYRRSNFFDEVEDIVSCAQLTKWLNEYPDDLDFNELPKKCKSGTTRRK